MTAYLSYHLQAFLSSTFFKFLTSPAFRRRRLFETALLLYHPLLPMSIPFFIFFHLFRLFFELAIQLSIICTDTIVMRINYRPIRIH